MHVIVELMISVVKDKEGLANPFLLGMQAAVS